MEWAVAKTGAEMFDSLHACGLGILITSATDCPVELRDGGLVYVLLSSIKEIPSTPTAILDSVLVLPNASDIGATEKSHSKVSVAIANLDGLLAAHFTVPGIRLVSMMDLLNKRKLNRSATRDALTKVGRAIDRQKKFVGRESRASRDWLSDLLNGYDVQSPVSPIPVIAGTGDLALSMVIDPAFSYSTRRPNSDGLITNKTNVTMDGTRYAPFLAFVGAARFLRAQRVANNLVNFYMPVPHSIVLHPETALPLLYPLEHATNHALVLQWLTCWQAARGNMSWKGLAYQVLQTQGAQQSISRERGLLDYDWLSTLQRNAGTGVTRHWGRLLNGPRQSIPYEIDNLLDCLMSHRAEAWMDLCWPKNPSECDSPLRRRRAE